MKSRFDIHLLSVIYLVVKKLLGHHYVHYSINREKYH